MSGSETSIGPSDPPRRSVDLPSGPASYTDEGPRSGPTIVLIHGLPGSARDFRWLAPRLAQEARVIRLEMPGFGGTPLSTAPDRGLEARAGFARRVIDALGLDRPLVVGHSMGGVVGSAVVARTPEAFAGLALLAAPGVTRHALLRLTPFKAFSWLLGRPWLAWALLPINRRAFAAMGFRRYPDHELVGTVHSVAHTPMESHRRHVESLDVETLVAYCEDDPLIEVEVARELAEVCPKGPRLVFESGGHNLQKTRAEEIAGAMLDWLRG